MPDITLEQATTVVTAALSHGHDAGMKPLTVAVLDAGGHLVALHREDGSSTLRPQVAIGKASGSVALGAPSRTLDAMARDRPHFFAALSALPGAQIVPVPGGVLVRDAGGDLLGAVGVSGDTSDNDEAAAEAGVLAAGLVAVTGREA